jgi:hypothetical protein
MRSSLSWFPWVFAASLALSVVVTLVVQSRSKWVVLRRIQAWRRWPKTMGAVWRALAWWEFRRLPTVAARRRPRQPPPSPPP